MDRPRVAALVFAAWTAFVWTTRIVNIAGDDDLGSVGAVWRLLVALGMTGLAVHVGWVALTRRDRLAAAVGGLAAWTVIVWLVRLPGIVLGGHSAAFVIVHAGLAVVSGALAVLAVDSAAGTVRHAGRAAVDG